MIEVQRLGDSDASAPTGNVDTIQDALDLKPQVRLPIACLLVSFNLDNCFKIPKIHGLQTFFYFVQI